jgi:hypothetical protein
VEEAQADEVEVAAQKNEEEKAGHESQKGMMSLMFMQPLPFSFFSATRKMITGIKVIKN